MLEIKLDKFEGPLSLLVKLIDQEEVDVTQVSLARVADQFVEYVRQSPNIGPEELADFLVVAARLLLIKSRALLPFLYPEEEADIEDLERQLKMYKEFINAAKQIEKILGKKKFMFAREFNRKAVLLNTKLFAPPASLTAASLKDIYKELIGRLRPPEKLEEKTLGEKINIEDRIINIQKMLLERIKLSFNKILKSAKNKTEVIVNFLAVLELMRQKEITLEQDNMFGDITILRNK